MEKVAKNERPRLRKLFEGREQGQVFVDSVIDGGYGIAFADNLENPKAAVLFFSGIVIYGGDPQVDSAKELINIFPVQPMILSNSQKWEELIISKFGQSVSSQKRFLFKYETLNQNKLRRGAPERLVDYEIRPIVATDSDALKNNLGWEHQIHHYSSLEQFEERGLGLCVTRGGEICAGISCFARHGNMAEVQVTTAPAHRRRGLATKLSAEFLLCCREEQVKADWDAANRESCTLAQKIGYTDPLEYRILSVNG